jgi:hypothetical protein
MSRSYTYRICVEEQIDPRWAEWLAGLALEHTPSGATTLTGPFVDQSALHGLLLRLNNLGLTLISVMRLEAAATGQDGD